MRSHRLVVCFRVAALAVLPAAATQAQPGAPQGLPKEHRMAGESGGQSEAAAAAGMEVSRRRPALTQPTQQTGGYDLRYGLGFPFQVAPGLAGLLCNARTVGAGHWDFEDGTDLVLFDRLDSIGTARALVVSRNETAADPATGRQRCAVKYPVVGGFVPLGARLPDGSAHPHAGTGFGLTQVLSFALNDAGAFGWDDPYVEWVEVLQFAYDGEGMRLLNTERRDAERPLTPDDGGGTIAVPGMSMALPDGADLLFAVNVRDANGETAGVSRWQREGEEWRPVAYVAVTGGAEPSLVRDVDGALLFAVRGYGEHAEDVRVWRSADSQVWEQVLGAPGVRSAAPVVLNQAADGTPYISGNLIGHGRALLCLWPLNAARSALEAPVTARDCQAEFGPPAERAQWFADHPTTATVQLADGQWHNLLSYRVMAFRLDNTGEAVTDHTGCYMEEVQSPGAARPAWRFQAGTASATDSGGGAPLPPGSGG